MSYQWSKNGVLICWRRYIVKLYHSRDDEHRQWREIHGSPEQQRGNCPKQSCYADGKCPYYPGPQFQRDVAIEVLAVPPCPPQVPSP